MPKSALEQSLSKGMTAQEIADKNFDMGMENFANSIENFAKDPRKKGEVPEGAEKFAKMLKKFNSGEIGQVEEAMAYMEDDMEDWLIESHNGKTNYERLCKLMGKEQLDALLMQLGGMLGMEIEPEALARGLKRLKKMQAGTEGMITSDDKDEPTKEDEPEAIDLQGNKYEGTITEAQPEVTETTEQMTEEEPGNEQELETAEPETTEMETAETETPEVKTQTPKKRAYFNNVVEGSSAEEDAMAKGYQSVVQRKGHKDFLVEIDAIGKDLEDKGFLGMRGSSKEHEKLVQAYHEMRYRSAMIVNAKENVDSVEKGKIDAMTAAKLAAVEYIAKIRKDAGKTDKDIDWRPKTPMGKKRFEAALGIIASVDKEMDRLFPPMDPEAQQEVQQEKQQEQITNEQLEQQNEIQQEKYTIKKDPDNPFDKQGWIDKINSIPSDKPMSAEQILVAIKETIKCMAALNVLDDLDKKGVPEDQRDADEFRTYLDEATTTTYNALSEKTNGIDEQWEMVMEGKEEALNEYDPSRQTETETELEEEEPQIQEEMNNEPGREPEAASGGETADGEDYDAYLNSVYGSNYLESSTYVENVRKQDGKLGEMAYEAAKGGMYNIAAMIITAKIFEKSGEKPSKRDFNNSVVDTMESPAFKETVEGFGGTSIGALERMQKSILKDGGKTLFGNFMQNAIHIKQREALNENIKAQAQAKRELALETPKTEKVLGGN